MKGLYVKLILVLFSVQAIGQAQRISQDALMFQYLERRIIMLEDRLEKCDRDIINYITEFRDFTKKVLFYLDGLKVYKTELKNEMESLSSRVESVERDIDYLEATTPSQPCVEVDEKLIDEQMKQIGEKKKNKFKLNADCESMLESIRSLKIVKKAGDVHGSWIKDPSKDVQKIYFLSGSKNNTFLEFANINVFTDSSYMQAAKNVVLPFHWQGTGHLIYNGFLFFHKYGTLNEIIKYNIRNKTVTDRMLLLGAGRIPAYQLSPFTSIDFAIDEQGLWAIHADPDTGGTIIVTKISQESLDVEHSWDSLCPSKDAEAAFLICGTLYVVYNTENGGRSRIQCIYDVADIINNDRTPVLYFPKRYGSHSMIHYNPRERQLFSWDDGYQTIYKLTMKKKTDNS